MRKKIAVIVRDRQDEALRMAVGLSLSDDIVDVYVLDREVEKSGANIMSLEAMHLMGIKTYSNFPGNKDMKFIETETLASRLLEYDSALPY